MSDFTYETIGVSIKQVADRANLIKSPMVLNCAAVVSLMLMPEEVPLTPCTSSNVDAWGYDAASLTMAVRFKGGGEYRYLGVGSEYARLLFDNPSAGRAVGILKADYPAVKVK